VLELESRGGRLGASDGEIMRNGETWLQDELATGSLASYAPGSAIDSVSFYAEKAELFMARGDNARALGLADSAWRLEKRMADDPKLPIFVRRTQYEVLAWLAALRGDRPTALSMLRQASESQSIAMYPDGAEAVQLTCTKAGVYGFLRDVDAMLPLVQRCFTKANGYPVAYLNDPEFWRNRDDPRFKALVVKLAGSR
jgi:hypothetical protein